MAGNPVRKAPYKDFLQPALQRRFSSTAAVLLVVSYIEALCLASWDSYLWSWFPIGPAGVRTTLIFACGLGILILRIAHYHVGLRTSGPGWQTLGASLASFQTYETAFWYGASSLLFAPIFLSSLSDSSNLRWVNYFSGDRARLNERPLFLVTYLGTCALLQTLSHFRRDQDRLVLAPLEKMEDDKPSAPSSPFKTVIDGLPTVFIGSVRMAVFSAPIALALYLFIVRPFAWGWTLMFFRLFYNLPKTSILPPTWPMDVFLIGRSIHAGTLLYFVWLSGNTAFSVFMVKAPLKGGQPLTFESKDPNGSLLNGLKSKKLPVKSFAMWELAQLAEESAVRRAAIFQDIDRKDGPMWSQIYGICMETLKSIETRIDNYGKPAILPPPEPAAKEPRQRVSAPLRDDPIFNSRAGPTRLRDEVGKAVGEIVQSSSSSPMSKLSPIAKKTWKDAKDRILSKDQQDAVSPDQLRSRFESVALSAMDFEYIASLFRRDFRSEFAATVLGVPYAEPTLYVNAITALCQLGLNSLAEDDYGNVHRDVPIIIRTLTAVIKKVDALKLRFPSHWTDVTGRRDCPEVDQVLDAARAGLGQILSRFEPYANDLRLSLADVRLAKEALANPNEVARKEKKPREADPKGVEPVEPRRARRRDEKRSEMEQVR